MTGTIWQIFITHIVVVFAFILIVSYLIRQKNMISLEKRFEKFSLLSVRDSEKSFFDVLKHFFWEVIHALSKKLSVSQVLVKYSQRYEKHIQYENRNSYSGMDYVSVKFLVSFFFVLLYLVSSSFQLVHVHAMNLLLVFLVGFFIPDLFLHVEYQQKRKRIEEDLLKAIIMMNNAFKSGRNIMQAVEIVMTELDGPISDEFKKIYMDMTYGLSMEVVFDRFYNRVKVEDAKYITSSLTLLSRTGGNIVRVFGSVERNFFDKKKLKQEMHSLIAASIFLFRTLCILPFVFVAVIFALNPNYFAPLFTSGLGLFFLVVILFIYILYVLIIKKVLEVRI